MATSRKKTRKPIKRSAPHRPPTSTKEVESKNLLELPKNLQVFDQTFDSIFKKIDVQSGLEPEETSEELEEEEELEFHRLKYDPSTIRVAFRQFPLDLLVKRIAEGAINFNPGFQRASDLWSANAKGRLIESVLIQIPLPVFYLDSSNEDRWDVIDGVQRLSTFKAFAVDKSLKLKGLEFMPELNGKGFDDLPRSLARRFLESNVTLYLIEKGTPSRVKQSIYERINTGGTTLVPQEIRHAIFQGPATKLLEEMVLLESFRKATNDGINSLRMADKECALRFAAFFLNDYRNYQTRDMDKFLSDTMEALSKGSNEDLNNIKSKFDSSMKFCFSIFGSQSFRKPVPKSQINKAVFETLSSLLAKLSEKEVATLLLKKKTFKSKTLKLLRDPDFIPSVSTGTGDVRKVHKRFSEFESLIKGLVNDN